MKIWILTLLIIGTALSLVNAGENDDDDYEVKRFHVQSRELGGSSTCFETRRKRSRSESNGVRDTYGAAPSAEEEDEIRASTVPGGTDSVSGILIQDSGQHGNAGVLVIRNQAANTPILFELRPVDTYSNDNYYENDDENSPNVPNEDDDEDEDTANDESSEEVPDESGNEENRYKPSADLDNDLGEDEETTVKRRRVPPKRKPSKVDTSLDTRKPSKTRKRISNLPAKRRPNRRENQSPNKIRETNKKRKSTKKRTPSKKRNQNRTRRRRPSKKRYESIGSGSDRRRYKSRTKGGVSYNRHQIGDRQDSNLNSWKNIGDNVDKGSGEKTVSRTISTTQTGTAADVNCIIITKEPTPTTQRPFWNILGRSASDSENRSFGHRKRFKNRLQFAYA